MRYELGGFPCDVEVKGDNLTLRFYPKSSDAEYPNDSVLVLKLNEADKQKLLRWCGRKPYI
jgi:hypothetical protein